MNETTMPTRGPTKGKTRALRFAIWGLLGLLLLNGLGAFTSLTSGGNFGWSIQATSPSHLSGADVVAQGPTVDAGSISEEAYANLPAWRWRSHFGLTTDNGLEGVVDNTLSELASVAFTIAGFVWGTILTLTRLALTTDALTSMANEVNQAVLSMTGALLGVIAVVWFAVLTRAGKLALKGGLTGAFRGVFTFLFPIAFLFYIGGAVQPNLPGPGNRSVSSDSIALATKGSPPWLAQQGISLINTTSEQFVTGFELFAPETDTVLGSSVGPVSSPNCTEYISALYDRYYAAAGDGNTSYALEQLSRLWLVSVYEQYAVANFSEHDLRNKATCHLLEEKAGIETSERQALVAAGTPDIGVGHASVFNLTTDEDDWKWGGANENKEQKLRIFNWMACDFNGGSWSGSPVWENVGDSEPGSHDGGSAGYCAARWSAGHSEINKQLGDLDNGEIAESTRKNGVDSKEARQIIDGYLGRDGTSRLMLGSVSTMTAFAYAAAFGGAAVGALVAQVGLVLMLMLLPVTLVLMSYGSRSGTKLLRMTIAMLASKFMFTLLLSVIAQVVVLGLAVMSSSGGASSAAGMNTGIVGAGWTTMIINAALPLICLYVLHRGAKAMGLGGLLSPAGAFGFVTKAATKATKAGSVSDFVGNNPLPGAKRARQAKASARRAAERGKRSVGDHAKQTGTAMLPARIANRKERKEVKQLGKQKKRIDKVADRRPGEVDEHGNKVEAKPTAAQVAIDKRIEAATAKLDKANVDHSVARTAPLVMLSTAGGSWLADKAGTHVVAPVADTARERVGSAKDKAKTAVQDSPLYPAWRKSKKRDADAVIDTTYADSYEQPSLASDPDAAQHALMEQNRAVVHATAGADDNESLETAAAVVTSTLQQAAAATVGNETGQALGLGELDTIRQRVAMELGVEPEHVLVDHFGNSVLDALSFESPMDIPVELRGRPELYLPPEALGALELETETDRATRISGTLAATGHIRVEGNEVVLEDLLEGYGIDLGTRAGEVLYKNYAEGLANAIAAMPSIELPAVGIGATMIGGAALASQIDRGEYMGYLSDMRVEAQAMHRQALEEIRSVAIESKQAIGDLSAINASVANAGVGDTSVDLDALAGQMDRVFNAQVTRLRNAIPEMVQLEVTTATLRGDTEVGTTTEEIQAEWAERLNKSIDEFDRKANEVDLTRSADEVIAFFEETMARLSNAAEGAEEAVEDAAAGLAVGSERQRNARARTGTFSRVGQAVGANNPLP